MAIKHADMFHSKALKNIPKLGFLFGMKVYHLATLRKKSSTFFGVPEFSHFFLLPLLGPK
jgi:hypothetical protein